MNLFAGPAEKGHAEWKAFSLAKYDRQPGSYRVILTKIVHLPINRAAPHHQQFFILKNAH